MKKTIMILTTFLFLACGNKSEPKKPSKFIESETMENILYDLALLQALKSYSPDKLKENSINPKTYIYQKYKIDSLQFAQNSIYYATDIDEYSLIFDRISKKIQTNKAKIDTINNRELKIKNKKTTDSLIKNSKKKGINKIKKDSIIVIG
jgi:hypothetical protein